MTVVRSAEDRDDQLISAAVVSCFLCGKALGFPFVYWGGCGAPADSVAGLPMSGWEAISLALHRECVTDLYKRMLRDVLEIEGICGPYRSPQ